MDLVSVIVIGYNVENTIEECLISIINQSYKNLEIIYIDDGSNDQTIKVVKKLSNVDKRIKYFIQQNQGANSARKTGFKYAHGNYCMFIDGDDRLINNSIEYALNANDNDYDFVCFDYKVFSNSNEYILENHPFINGIFKEYEYLESILQRKQAHYLWNKLYKTVFLKKIDFDSIPSITMGDDLAANVRMGVFKPKVISIKSNLYEYRKNPNSVSRKPNKKYLDLIDMMRYIESQLRNIGKYDIYKELIDYNYFLNFYYYVVRNKYKYSYIQKEIYHLWKSQNIKLTSNIYIKEKIQQCTWLEKLLIYTINFSDIFEYIITYLCKLFMCISGKDKN